MFWNKKKQSKSECVEILVSQMVSLSEKNGKLKAEIRAIAQNEQAQANEIRQLERRVHSLVSAQDSLIGAGEIFGINLKPILKIDQPGAEWITRGLSLAGGCFKPKISKLKIPNLDDALADDALNDVVRPYAGGNKVNCLQSYENTKINAEKFILNIDYPLNSEKSNTWNPEESKS